MKKVLLLLLLLLLILRQQYALEREAQAIRAQKSEKAKRILKDIIVVKVFLAQLYVSTSFVTYRTMRRGLIQIPPALFQYNRVHAINVSFENVDFHIFYDLFMLGAVNHIQKYCIV